MRKLLTAFAFATVLASCQKEISFDSENSSNNGGTGSTGGTGNTSGLLVKTVAVTGTETQTTLYTYDAQKRLETMKITGVSGGMPVNSFHKYIRDNAGRIVKVLQKIEMPGVNSDTAVKTYHYPNATTLNYDYSVHVMSMDMGGGMTMSTIDSAAYNYTASGKMTSFNQYMFSSLVPGNVMMNSKWEFTYDASDRVTNMKTYTDSGNPGSGVMELDMEWKYTYAASSVNHLFYTSNAAQNLALNGLPNTTTDFISKSEASSTTSSPPLNIVMTTTFVNGANNKPASGTVVTVTTGQPTQTTNYTFFYQ